MTPDTDAQHQRTVTETGYGQDSSETTSADDAIDEPDRPRDAYRLYSRSLDDEPDSLVGSYDTIEEAKEKMRSISYDMDPGLFFYIMHGDEVVVGDPAGRNPPSQVALSEVTE